MTTVVAERTRIFTFTISSGQTESGIQDLRGFVPVGLHADGWTAGNLTFKASLDDSTTPVEVVDSDMSAVTITSFDADKAVQLPPDTLRGVRRLQLVSQNSQGADRNIQVLCRRID